MLRLPTILGLSPTPDSKTEVRLVLLFETSEYNIYRADVTVEGGTYSDNPVLWAEAMAAGWAKIAEDARLKRTATEGADFSPDVVAKQRVDDYDPDAPRTFIERRRVVVERVSKELA